MRTTVAIVFAMLMLLSACAGSAPAPSEPAAALEGTQWTLRDFAGHRPSPRPVTLRFEAGRASGRAPCNAVSANYTRDGDGNGDAGGESLRFGPITASKMYCADAAALEDAYLAALRQIDRASIEGQILTLSGAGAQLAYSSTPED